MKKILLLSILSVFLASCASNNNLQDETNSWANVWVEVDQTATVEEGNTVKVHYEWTLENWEIFDSSYDRWEPIEFTSWNGEMIPWFDAAVIGMSVGEKKSITLSPSEAYGERSEENYDIIQKEELSDFEENGIEIQTGAVLPTMYGEFEIVWVDAEDVTVDMNHPMAWKTLNFDVELVEIVK